MTEYNGLDDPTDLRKLVLADLDKAMQPVADAIDKDIVAASSPRAHLRGYSAAELTARVERFRKEAADFASRAHALACAGELTPLTAEERREHASLMQRARYRMREIRALEQRGIPEEAIAAVGIQAAKLRAYGDAVDARLAKRMAEAMAPTLANGGMVMVEDGKCTPIPLEQLYKLPSLFSRFRRWLTRWTIGP